MDKVHEKRHRKIVLFLCCSVDLTILFVFKYLDFFGGIYADLASLVGPPNEWRALNLVLPIGISFYTIQSLGYIADVYREKTKVVHSYVDYLNFILFFPQLVAGPISQAEQLMPQVASPPKFKWSNLARAAEWLIWGYFLKVVVSDNLSFFVKDFIMGNEYFEGPATLLRIYCGGIQFYCDFAGYSAIAIGLAELFGIQVMHNFREPLLSLSLQEFWTRWHISLSVWVRDNIYFPLKGKSNSTLRVYFCVMVTSLVMALWHGAAWSFVVWGINYGLINVLERIVFRIRAHYKKTGTGFFGTVGFRLLVYFHVYMFNLVFFMSKTPLKAIHTLGTLFSGWNFENIYSVANSKCLKQLIIYGGSVLLLEAYRNSRRSENALSFLQPLTKPLVYATLIVVTVLFGVNYAQQFAYFQF